MEKRIIDGRQYNVIKPSLQCRRIRLNDDDDDDDDDENFTETRLRKSNFYFYLKEQNRSEEYRRPVMNQKKLQSKNSKDTELRANKKPQRRRWLNNEQRTENARARKTNHGLFWFEDLHTRGKDKSCYVPLESKKEKLKADRVKTLLRGDNSAKKVVLKSQISIKDQKVFDKKNSELQLDSEKVPALEQTDILEEALLRNSIRKCELWLQKYF